MNDTTPANTTEAPAVAGCLDQPVRRHAMSRGGLQSTVIEAYQALYGASTRVTGDRVTAQRHMVDDGSEWLCIRFNSVEALTRARDALKVLEEAARRLGA